MPPFDSAQPSPPDLLPHLAEQRHAPPLLVDMPALIRGWTDLTPLQSRDYRSAINAALRICGTPDPDKPANAAPIPATMSCAYLNTKLFRQAPALYGINTPERFANLLSLLRAMLRRLGGHDRRWAGFETLAPAWRQLHDALPTEHRRIAMAGFMRFCGDHGIDPRAVISDTLARFEAWLHDRTLCRDAAIRARAVASNWSWARTHVEGWPDLPLVRPRMRAQYVLPLTTYPAELQADVERFLGRLSCNGPGDIFEDDAATSLAKLHRRRALRPRTVEGRRFQIRQCLAALMIAGRDPASITCLRDLVDPPEQAHAIMAFFVARAGNKLTSQTRGIGEVLRQIARFHCCLGPDAITRVTRWSKNVIPKQVLAVSEKNMRRLQALLAPHNRLRFLNLPRTLVAEADTPGLRPHSAALLAMYAVTLDTLLVYPLRASSLSKLRIDRDLQRTNPRSRLVDFITAPLDDNKTEVSLTWPVPPDVAKRLDHYLTHHHPNLTVPGNPFLLPKMGTTEERSPTDLGIGLTQVVEARIGCEFNIHLVRHFVVALVLERYPGQYDLVRHLLGHAKTSYTIAVYDAFGAQAAARCLDETLTHARGLNPAKIPSPTKDKGRRGAGK